MISSERYRLVVITGCAAFAEPGKKISGRAALVATLGPGQFAPTTDLHVQFLRPARPGRLIGRGRVVRRGKDVAFLAGELADDSGQIVAVATATAQICAMPS